MSSRRLRAVPVLSLAIVAGALALAMRTARPVDAPPAAPPPQNVILISLDTLRADHLGAWGYARDTSPRIDALARESVIFRRAVAQGSSTIPSHASLFTAQYASAVVAPMDGLMDWPETLAEALSGAGFATWGFVDGGNVRRHFGFDQGFDHYEDDRVGVQRLVARAKQWILRNPVPRFFLFLHTYQIHTPYQAPREYVSLFGDPSYKGGGFEPNTRYFRWIEERGRGLPERERREVVARYDAGIRYTDERIGDFLDWLDERGILADSLVVIVSDHGEEFLEHGRLGHHQVHLDPNLRVPLIFHRPGMSPAVIEETVELTDVAPTILDLTGIPPLPDSIGQSLRVYLEGGRRPGARPAYSEKGSVLGEHTLVTDRYQLIEDRKTKERRLYDLHADPASKRDVYEAEPDVAARLTAELEERSRRAERVRHERQREARRQKKREPLDEKMRRELEALGYLEP